MAKILIKKEDEVIGSFYKSHFDLYANSQKEKIYERKKKENLKLFCTCTEEEPALTMAKSQNNNIFIKNISGNGKKHLKSCLLHSEYESDNDNEKGWNKDQDDNYIANLSKSAYGKQKRKPKSKEDDEEDIIRRTPNSKNKKGSSTVTLLGLMMRLNTLTWDRYMNSAGKAPDDIVDFMKKAYGTSHSIKIKNKKSLHDLWYSYSKFKDLKLLFVFMPLVTIRKSKHPLFCEVVLMQTVSEKDLTISCPITLFEESYASVRIKDLKRDDEGFNSIIGGFVMKNKRGYLEFVSMEFMPIIHQGLWCESSYEKRIYSKLVNDNRIFSRGYEAIDIYGDHNPDIIFKDTERMTFGEIFGISNIESYTAKKEEKIALAEELKDVFDFWYWDVTSVEPMKAFPEKTVGKK